MGEKKIPENIAEDGEKNRGKERGQQNIELIHFRLLDRHKNILGRTNWPSFCSFGQTQKARGITEEEAGGKKGRKRGVKKGKGMIGFPQIQIDRQRAAPIVALASNSGKLGQGRLIDQSGID